MEKFTKRAMFETLISYAQSNDMELTIAVKDGTVTAGSADVIAFAENEIAQLDKKAVKAKERAATKKTEGDALTEAVLAAVGTEFETTADIAARIEGEDVTVSKVSYRLTALAKAGKVIKEDIKVTGADGKKATLKGYKLA